MTVAVTTLRSTLATALENAGVWQVFAFPPATPIANSVIVQPDDPYLEPSNNIYATVAPKANFKVCKLIRIWSVEVLSIPSILAVSENSNSFKLTSLSICLLC